MVKNKDQKQLELDLFEKPKKEWEKHGFATREQWLKAKNYDRAWRHMEQSNLSRLKKSMIHKTKTNLFMAIGRMIRELLK